MAALRLSPFALRRDTAPSSSVPSVAVPVSSSLRILSSIPRRLRSLRPASRSSRRPRRGAAGAAMMDTAASSYANALCDVAQSNDSLEATVTDMEKVEKVFADPAVQSFFSNPVLAPERKAEVVKEICASCELQPHTANFLNILVDMRRTDIIKEIAKEFEASYNRITNTEVAVVSSVVALESQDLAQIAQAVQKLTGAKNVRIKTVLDPSLIAGFTIRYGPSGSKFIDMSVKKQLDEIASQLDFSSISLVQ
ncbi:ATP synthase subunit delta, chloroplastic-like [Canna indica]|uniref:ATP synthase subunit delta, chloroplastic-like n=1 Tax=Canna indica TaxID=4628 RepID=A0AAQ3QHR2_9LILI|nr:ATP synthase subunit delta, chloroplastic-like [Canna indica]